MSQESQELTVQPDELRAFSETLYRKVGVPRDHAETMANFQVETDLRGVYSHGTRAQPRYIQGILDGNINPTPRIEVVKEGPCIAVIDGDSALGHLPSAMAMEMAVEKAKSMGIAGVGVRNAGHFGAAACYGMMAVREKLIGFAATSTSMEKRWRSRRRHSGCGKRRILLRASGWEGAAHRARHGMRHFSMGEDQNHVHVRYSDPDGLDVDGGWRTDERFRFG